MRHQIECTGVVRTDLSPHETLALLTPEGERRWVEGWDPRYPVGGTPDPAPGVTFVVGKDEGASVWIVTRFEPSDGRAAYAYVLPGHRTCLVEVEVTARPDDDGSAARVTYRMTSLTPEADAFVDDFAAGYDDFLQEWEELIRREVPAGT